MAKTSFSADISRFIEKAQGREDLVVRKVALDIFRRVILRTPVKTGRARGNWQASIGEPATGTSLNTTDKNGGSTVGAASGVVKDAKAGDRVFLANNLTYIVPLEEGHSKQAPAGMVGITVQEFVSSVAQAAGEAKSAIK